MEHHVMRLQRALPSRYQSASPDDLASAIAFAKETLGSRVLVLGHHYQRDEVMRWADARGDSLALAHHAAAHPEAGTIVFCGVHFMAESADMLTAPGTAVVLPDLNAGCSMADMADCDDVEDAWHAMAQVTDTSSVIPITYINSSAAVKAFVGRHGGSVCTSSNARAVLEWALEEQGATKVFFIPDQHLGRNTAIALGIDEDVIAMWDPRREMGGLDEATLKGATVLLWKGHCSVHQRFRPEHVRAFRQEHPAGIVVVHPECSHDVVSMADVVGSTDAIIRAAREAAPGSVLAVGTEIHLVNRLAGELPDRTVLSLDPLVCPCSTMNRIDAAHLAWVLDELMAGRVPNRITVDEATASDARKALDRMLSI